MKREDIDRGKKKVGDLIRTWINEVENLKETGIIEDKKNRKILQWNIPQILFFEDAINLDADYQRLSVWKPGDRTLLIDSIIENIDIPKFYLAERPTGDYDCIDGKQRLLTIYGFFYPDNEKYEEVLIKIENEKYNIYEFAIENPEKFEEILNLIKNYQFMIIILKDPPEQKIRDYFKRLQLGEPLNTGERLNAIRGDIRNFVFDEIDRKKGYFIEKTNLAKARFSRQHVISQIVFNHFKLEENQSFKRARKEDLEYFFESKYELNSKEKKYLADIKEILKIIDKKFLIKDAENIRGRAAVVSIYFYVRYLYKENRSDIPSFIKFFTQLQEEINNQTKILRSYKEPDNKVVLNYFLKYVQQASVESYSIRNRHIFLNHGFIEWKETKNFNEKWQNNVQKKIDKEMDKLRKKEKS